MNLPSDVLPLPPAYFDRNSGGFWHQDARGAWMRLKETDFVRFLKDFGYSGKSVDGEELSTAARTLMRIQMAQNIDYAGPVAGYSQGLIEMEGKSVLVTDSPKIVEAEPGQFPTIQALLSQMFGEEQLPYFEAWVKLAYESLVFGNLRPGHAVVLAGPRASGKSLMQKIVTVVLGGRAAHPYRHMTGGTEFNSELFGAEHLIIDDQCGSSDFKSRQKLTAQFKMVTAAGSQQCHPKGKPALTLSPFWRLTVSVNDDPESLLVLPLIREDLEDKIMLFKIESHGMPMSTRTNAERTAFWNRLMTELPHWVHHLTNWALPDELVRDRFGVNHYHHREIIEAMESLSPHMKLYQLIEAQFRGAANPGLHWVGTAAELEALLTGTMAINSHEARKLFSWPTACGTYLAALSKKHPGVASRDSRCNNLHRWRIDLPGQRETIRQSVHCQMVPPTVPSLALLN